MQQFITPQSVPPGPLTTLFTNQQLFGAIRIRLGGTARLWIRRVDVPSGRYNPGSQTIPDNEFLFYARRQSLEQNARLRLVGRSTARGLS